MYLSAQWKEGQPWSHVVVISSTGNVFRGDFNDGKIKGATYKAEKGHSTTEKPTHDVKGFEFSQDNTIFEGTFDGNCSLRVKA